MSADTTHLPTARSSDGADAASTGRSFTPSRAAGELGVKRAELELAVHLGLVRTVPDPGGGSRRIRLREIERLRAEKEFPASLRRRVWTVGTQEAAALLGVPAGRFTRLARLGLVTPVRLYLNRYRAVVWLYLAEELRQFADREDTVALLRDRMPKGMRDQLASGVDLRARNWRGRHLGFLLSQNTEPWEQAAAMASFLGPGQVADLVPDPYERAHLERLRPEPPVQPVPESPAAHLVARITTAQEPDEIGRLRSDLARTVDEAREERPAPRPVQPSEAFDAPPQRPGLKDGAFPAAPRQHTARPASGGTRRRGSTASTRPCMPRPTGRRDPRTPRVPRWRELLTRLRTGRRGA